MSARAIATRCCWPPESSDGRCRRRSERPTRSRSASSAVAVGLAPGDRQRQEDVLLGAERRQQVEGLKDEADVLAAQLVSALSLIVGDVVRADVDGALGRAIEAGEEVHERRLARARGAHDGRELAGGDVDGHAAKRVDRRLALAVAAGHGLRGDGGGRGRPQARSQRSR